MENNRDLLIVSKYANLNKDALQEEVDMLIHVLYGVESIQKISIVSEIYDLNSYRTIRKPRKIAAILQSKEKPFIFIGNKN